MQSQSGFFTNPAEDITNLSSPLELMHTSGSGFTVLYKSRQGGRIRVYKCLKDSLKGDPLYENLLRKEFEIGYMLSHPAICEFYSFAEVPDKGHGIEMEWIDGKTLAERIEEGSLRKATAEKIILELCDALEYMHRKQIIHRDLKPENIMVTTNSDNVKIIDFGFSDSDSHLLGKAPAGTRSFASPELLSGEDIDCRSDIYSLGKIIALMPGGFSAIAEKCTKENRENRYSSAMEVKEAILKTKKRKWWILLAVLISATVICTALYLLNMSRNQKVVDDLFYQTTDMIKNAGFTEASGQE